MCTICLPSGQSNRVIDSRRELQMLQLYTPYYTVPRHPDPSILWSPCLVNSTPFCSVLFCAVDFMHTLITDHSLPSMHHSYIHDPTAIVYATVECITSFSYTTSFLTHPHLLPHSTHSQCSWMHSLTAIHHSYPMQDSVLRRRKRIMMSKYRPEAAMEASRLYPKHLYQVQYTVTPYMNPTAKYCPVLSWLFVPYPTVSWVLQSMQ